MSFVLPNIFDFVARKNDERYVHERVLAQLFNDKRYQDVFLKEVCNHYDWKITKVLEQPTIRGRKSRSGHGFADILLLATNDKEELLPIIVELKTGIDASDSQLADYYYGIKNEPGYCKNSNPILLYVTPDGRDASSKALTSRDNSNKKLEKNKEYRVFSYRDLMSFVEIPETSEICFDFVLLQYKKLVNEAEFCGFKQVDNTSENFNRLKCLFSSVYKSIKTKRCTNNEISLRIESNIENNGQYHYYYIDIRNEYTCLRFEFGYSSSNCKEDCKHLRILYGAKRDDSFECSWKTADYKYYLQELKENGKTVYCTNNKGNPVPKEIEGLVTKGEGENHLNTSVWLFAQNLGWLANDVVSKENDFDINKVAERIADFIISDLGKISPIATCH